MATHTPSFLVAEDIGACVEGSKSDVGNTLVQSSYLEHKQYSEHVYEMTTSA